MAQEGAFWRLSSVIRFGPLWCNDKITWANIVHAVLDVGISKHTILNMVGAAYNAVAQP